MAMPWFRSSKKVKEERSCEDNMCQAQGESLPFGDLLTRDYSYRSLGPVFACVELISNAIASMPLRVVKIDEHHHCETVSHDPLNIIFKNKNLQTMTMPAIMKSVMTDVLLKGAGYILIERGVSGVPIALRYLPYGSVSCIYNEYKNTLSYQVSLKINDSQVKKSGVKSSDIIHITRLTRDGVNGMSVMQFAKNSADLAKCAEMSAQNYFNSGMNVNGLLSAKQAFSQQQID
jgi:HK97 family phage portal protein